MSGPSDPGLPAHYTLTRAQRLFSGVSIAAAFLLFAAFGVRIATGLDLWQWWVPLAFVGGIAAAISARGSCTGAPTPGAATTSQ